MSSPTLHRTLGRWDLTAIGVNQVIGAAIFLLPADVARQVGSWGPLMFAAIGLASMFIALCFAEVGSRFESTGGPIGPARAAPAGQSYCGNPCRDRLWRAGCAPV